jgi:hypothetical protein
MSSGNPQETQGEAKGVIGKMFTKNESEVKANVEQANDGVCRADKHFIHGLDEWIEWRAEKLQEVRQEIVAKTRLTRQPDPASRARAAMRG